MLPRLAPVRPGRTLATALLAAAALTGLPGTPTSAQPVPAAPALGTPVPAVAAPTVDRLAGPNRYATAVAVSQQAFPTGQHPSVVFLASGVNYPDALSAAPAAAVLGGISLLTDPSSLTPVIEAELRRLAPAKVVILGSTGAVAAAVEDRVRQLAPVERIGGVDRFDTSRLVAEYVFAETGATRAWIATGLNFPDALAAGAAAGANGAPLVMLPGGAPSVDDATLSLFTALGTRDFVLAGSVGAVSSGIEQSLQALIPGATVHRAGGSDRYETARLLAEHGFPNLSPGRTFLATGLDYPDALVGSSYAARLGRPLLVTSPLCAHPTVRSMLLGPNHTSLTLLGGTGALRSLVGTLEPCQSTSTASSQWVVVNKRRPLDPLRYVPSGLVTPNVRYPGGHRMRSDAAAALASMFDAARAAGVGEMSIASGYRSYDTQAQVYNTRLRERGRAYADAWIARPGYSEHQTGLTADIAAVGSTFNDIAGTPQGRWLAANSWRYGFILRYPVGQTAVTGYNPEPWHFRFVGVALATDYYRDGWSTLEAYAGLPPAPTYAGQTTTSAGSSTLDLVGSDLVGSDPIGSAQPGFGTTEDPSFFAEFPPGQ